MSELVLDTHVLVWWLEANRKLPRKTTQENDLDLSWARSPGIHCTHQWTGEIRRSRAPASKQFRVRVFGAPSNTAAVPVKWES
jgi:hypothetical protein